MTTKYCKQCGALKPIDQFRKYYAGRKGTYTYCKTCEKINARYKYLRRKEILSNAEQEELHKIETLKSLCAPKPSISLDDMISSYTSDLSKWQTEELTEEPDYYLDTIYEDLRAKYRPEIKIDTNTLQPVYDDTYKAVLDEILERFYTYEDTYWEEKHAKD